MESAFFDALAGRRTVYAIGNREIAPIDKVRGILELAVAHTPTAFNSQSGRVVLLLGAEHARAWDMIEDALRAIVPGDRFDKTAEKIGSFRAGLATILYYEDMDAVRGLQESYPSYRDNFPVWAAQANGMLQLAVWTGLSGIGYGASLQHYGEVVEDGFRRAFGIADGWKLVAQMPFGNPLAKPDAKTSLPTEGRIKVLG